MRRNDRAIPDFSAMLAVVRQCDCCRLGLVENGEAYIVPLNFGWEAEGETLTLYFHGAAEGRKLALLRQNPAVSFEMDTAHRLLPGETGCACSYAYRSVMGRGVAELLTDDAEKRHGLQCVLAHCARRRDLPLDARMVRETAVIRLRVTAWTAKAHEAP